MSFLSCINNDNNNYLRQSATTQNGSALVAGGNVLLSAGGNVLLSAGGNANLTASSVTAGQDIQIAAQNVTVQAGVNSSSNEYRTGGKDYLNHTASSTQSLTGGSLSAGNNLAIQATGIPTQAGTGDITLNAAQLAAQNGQVALQAAHDITLGTVNTTQSNYSHTYTQSSGLFSSRSTTDIQRNSATTAHGTTVSGNSVAMVAGNNLTVTGSSVTGAGNTPGSSQVSMIAGGNLIINAASNSESLNSTSSESGGLFGGESNNTANQSQTTAQRAQIHGSSIQMQSGGDTVLQAAEIRGQNISVNAGTIDGQVVNPNAHIVLDDKGDATLYIC
ncbi:MAG: hemagglutinin repeat-containing protein [Betaproteobacteria bacterium]|nr:hemagglutinin repeat-containing protein [Betaproteobacteria bacterium]